MRWAFPKRCFPLLEAIAKEGPPPVLHRENRGLGDLESDRHSKVGTGKLCGMCRPLEREGEFRLLLGTPSSLFVSYAFFVVWLPPFILPPIQHLSCIGCLCGVSARPNPAAFRLSRSICNRWLPGTAGGGGDRRGGGDFPDAPKKATFSRVREIDGGSPPSLAFQKTASAF